MNVDARRATWLTTVGLAAGALGVLVAVAGVPNMAVTLEKSGGRVLEVLPGGPGWQDSIRRGQTVVTLNAGERAEDWVLETSDGSGRHRAVALSTADDLRSSLPLAALACLLGGLAVVMVRSRPAWAAALAVTAIALGTVPFLIAGDALQWTAMALVASAAVAIWIASPGGFRRLRVVGAAVVAGVAVGWAVIRFTSPELFTPIDGARTGTLVAGVALGWLFTIDGRDLVARARRAGFPNRLDLTALGLVAAVALATRVVLDAEPWVTIVIAVVLALLYSRWRHGLAAATDRVLMAETRERAAIGAIEAERARVARDLHDAPLQELSGVIKNLELKPEASRETTALRAIAQHLRDVAIELHPPQLQDLGLGAALEHLVRQANVDAPIPVELDLDDQLGSLSEARLPADMELALYRVTQEAIANAQGHSGGSLVQVEAAISPGHVLIEINDDGCGLLKSDIEAAQRAGHFGLASMRQRAAIVGADLSMETGGDGTHVVVEWSAP